MAAVHEYCQIITASGFTTELLEILHVILPSLQLGPTTEV